MTDNLFTESSKLGALLVILVLSLFAVSFPAISKQVPVIRVPHVIFFMGKHFGTGVILSTAFCHLLQDSFKSLQNSQLKEFHPKIGKWTGLIILCSLLLIFLVEYVSTTCVDYLHASPQVNYTHPENRKSFSVSSGDRQLPSITPGRHFLLAQDHTPHIDPVKHKHHSHHTMTTVELITNSHQRIKCCISDPCTCNLQEEEQTICYDERPVRQRREQNDTSMSKIGKRQLIGILVLQLGIMIHSLVIGLALSIKRGSDFASLFIAICFHQAFEGLSLGIRIDALPPFQEPFLSTTASSSQVSISYESTPLLPNPKARKSSSQSFNSAWMKTILSILFALTTPFSMILGLAIFPYSGTNQTPKEMALFLLTQGVMSAISAGMLIYAATVEMLAADFVFGDVSGGHLHNSPSHAHDRVSDLEENARGHVRYELSENRDGRGPAAGELHHPEGHQTSTIGQKVLAVASLLAGVAVMNITAIFE